MDKLKILIASFIFLSLSNGAYSQNELDAQIISGNIDVCDNESATVELAIQFTGETPFMYKIRLSPNAITTSEDYVYTTDVDENNILYLTKTISLPIPEDQPIESFQIQVTEMSKDGNTWTDTTDPGVTFTNWKLPSPGAGADIDSCGLTAVLSGVPDPISSDYQWETPAQGSLSDPATANSSFNAPAKGTYSLTFIQENGACSAQDEVTVIFRGSPSASISSTSEVCGTSPQNATLQLSFTGEDNPWTFAVSDGENQPINGTATTAEHSEQVSVQGETTYSLLWVKDSNGCMSRTEDLTGAATIVDLQPQTDAGADFLACGLASELAAINDKGTGTWSSDYPEISISSVNDPQSPVEASEQGTYTLTWTENNNGCVNSDNIEIRFKELPTISFDQENAHICEGDEANFPFLISGNNGPWTLNYNLGEEPNSINYQNAFSSLSVSPGQTTDVLLTTITDQFGCETALTTNLSVLVDQKPTPNAGNDKSVCGLEVQLNAEMSVSAQYGEWQFPTGSILNNESNDPDATYQSTSWGPVTLTWLETNGLCTATDEVTIRFDEPPVVYAGEDLTLYNQYETTLRAGQPVNSTENWIGEWYIFSGDGSIANPEQKDATISGLKHGTVGIQWTVTNGACPPVSDSLTINVKGLTYHTGISPNNDALNDFFSLKGAHTIPQNQLLIFDQSGKVVYQQNDLDGENDWDGTDNDGNPLENGIYYFIFKGDGIDPVKDYIVIKRNIN